MTFSAMFVMGLFASGEIARRPFEEYFRALTKGSD
jgi:hypothetical protein